MKRRPEHAIDCPGCETGWTASGLLCQLCESAVHTAQPTFFDRWMNARALAQTQPDMVATEAYRRGLIIGTARALSAARTAQRATWRKKP